MTAGDLIRASMRKLTLYASGEEPEPEELIDGLVALKGMLKSWGSNSMMVFASVKESFSLVSGVYQYTWGSGGMITTARPHALLGASIVDSGGTTHTVDIRSEGEYRRITSKLSTGRPNTLFFHPEYPLALIYVHPVPTEVELMYVDSRKAFVEVSSFDLLESELQFPDNYEEAMIYNLAVRLASDYGKSISQEVASLAVNLHDEIMNLNASNSVEPVAILLPVGNRGSFNINTGR